MKRTYDIKFLTVTAMLAALAGVLMSLEISLPMMPPFYKLDFSDVPSIVALFSLGPVSAASVEIIKILIKLITVGTNSAYVGELANLIGVAIFIVPVWLVYRRMNQTKKAARVSLIVSVPVRVAFSCCVNAFITLPLYAKAMHLPMDAVIQMVASVNPAIKNMNTFIILATIPFNLLKNTANCVIGYVLWNSLNRARVLERRVASE